MLSPLMKTDLRILVLFFMFGIVLFWPVFLGKVNLNGNLLVSFYGLYGQNLPFKYTGWDQLRIYLPFYQVTFEQMKAGIVPLWNPYAFSGHPHAADFQSAVFYPLNIFGLFLPLIDFWHLLRISPAILASFFTYLFLRGRKLSLISSIFGAITFGFSPFILTWGEEVVMSPHSIIWLPLIMFGIDRYAASDFRHLDPASAGKGSALLENRKRFFASAQNDIKIKAQNDSAKWYLVLIAVSTAFSFLGGYMQTSIYLFIFVGAYLLLKLGLRRLFFEKTGLGFMLSFILGTGLAGVQLIPSAELFFNSARSQIALTERLYEFLLPFESLLTYLAPDFFGNPATGNFFRMGSALYYEGILFVGIAVLVFATLSILYMMRDKLVWFLAAATVVSLLTVLDSPISRWFLTLPIPFLSTSIPNRIIFIPAFCLAVLGAIGMDLWLKGKAKILGTLSFYAFLYGLIISTLIIINYFDLPYFVHAKLTSHENILVSFRNLILPVGVFGATLILMSFGSISKRKQFAAVLIMAVSALQTFYFSQKYFSFSERKYVFPKNDILDFVVMNQKYDRTWEIGQNFFSNNFASYYGIYWPGGYDSLNNRSYGEFSYVMQGNSISDYSFRADAGIGQGSTKELFDLRGGAERKRLMDLVGVRYLIGESEEARLLDKHGFNEVFNLSGISVFENRDILPRAFLASNYEGPPPLADVVNMSDEEIAKERRKRIFERLLDEAFDFKNVLILEKSSPISPQYGSGTSEIVSYNPNEVIVKTKSDQPKLLFLTDNYYPGWKAKVDGEETEILRADYTFRAVPLVAGEHEVRFYYDPMSFKVGVLISMLSLVGLIFLVRSRFKH